MIVTSDKGKYNGSSAYWANKLKPCLENSTHLNADNVGREQITQRLIDNKEQLYEWLRNPEDSNYKIIEVIKKEDNSRGKFKQERA